MDYLTIIVLVAFATEILLSATWNRLYFRRGIAVFRYDIQGLDVAREDLSPEALSERFSKGWSRSFLFKALSPTEIAFREKMMEFRLFSYTPVMHGLIRLSPERRSASVVGHINWWFCLFTVMAAEISFNIEESGYIFTFGILGVAGLLYAIQRSRYRKIGDAIREGR